MRDDIFRLLSLARLPGRLTGDQAASLLGFMPHDLPILTKARLLMPLGRPPQQAVKYFSSVEIEKCAKDPDWLNRATRAIYQHWINQNRKRSKEPRRLHTTELLAA